MTAIHPDRILVVEDDPQLAKMLFFMLKGAGYDVQTASCGAAALTEATAIRPDLVVLDLGLPDIDGYRVCRMLRKLYHSSVVPVVMLTAMDQPIDQLRGFAHGADAYLTKPCQPNELLKTVGTLLEQAGAPDP